MNRWLSPWLSYEKLFLAYFLLSSFVAASQAQADDELDWIRNGNETPSISTGDPILDRMLIEESSENFDKSTDVMQCVMPLPIGGKQSVLGRMSGFFHTFLKQGDRTYGMPFTRSFDYFGGDALISSPDPFYSQSPSAARCFPAYRPKEISDEHFSARFSCIAEKISQGIPYLDSPYRGSSGYNAASASFPKGQWFGVLDYHWAKNNCHSAARLVLDCAGGRISLNPNGGLGSKYKNKKAAKIVTLNYDHPRCEGAARAVFEQLTEMETAILAANFQDAVQIMSVGDLSTRIDSDRFSKTYKKILDRFRFWDGSNREFVTSSFRELRSEVCTGTPREGAVEQTTYQGVCERARRECI